MDAIDQEMTNHGMQPTQMVVATPIEAPTKRRSGTKRSSGQARAYRRSKKKAILEYVHKHDLAKLAAALGVDVRKDSRAAKKADYIVMIDQRVNELKEQLELRKAELMTNCPVRRTIIPGPSSPEFQQ